jgi:hypothetical protein
MRNTSLLSLLLSVQRVDSEFSLSLSTTLSTETEWRERTSETETHIDSLVGDVGQTTEREEREMEREKTERDTSDR